MEIEWEFRSWVPLVSRFCPNDTYRIAKRGTSIRMDYSLVGMEGVSWLRADASLRPRQRVEHCLLAFIDRVFEHPDIGIFFSTAATEEGERLNVLVDVMVRPFHAVCLPLFSDAMDAGELRRCDPALLFSVLMQGISKTVAYAHVLRAVSPLPDDPGRFKRELTDVALHQLR